MLVKLAAKSTWLSAILSKQIVSRTFIKKLAEPLQIFRRLDNLCLYGVMLKIFTF